MSPHVGVALHSLPVRHLICDAGAQFLGAFGAAFAHPLAPAQRAPGDGTPQVSGGR